MSLASRKQTDGGCCDCGDSGAWEPSGFCSKHGRLQTTPELLGSIPEALLPTAQARTHARTQPRMPLSLAHHALHPVAQVMFSEILRHLGDFVRAFVPSEALDAATATRAGVLAHLLVAYSPHDSQRTRRSHADAPSVVGSLVSVGSSFLFLLTAELHVGRASL